MKLLIRRDQKSGMLSLGAITFSIDARAELTPQEIEWVKKYRMGKTTLYQKYELVNKGSGLLGLASRLAFKAMNITVTVEDLVNGKHIECKDIVEMCAVVEQIKEACQNFSMILATAGTFGGEEVVGF